MRWRCATWTTRSSSLGDHLHRLDPMTGSAQAAAAATAATAGQADMGPNDSARHEDTAARLFFTIADHHPSVKVFLEP